MNARPRCREWLPLSTQQLRLRNLRRIQGVNINCQTIADYPVEILLHYTLHHNPDSEAVYQSELLPYRKHLQQMWTDINCDALSKSNATYICVKIWSQKKTDFLQNKKTNLPNPTNNNMSAFSRDVVRNEKEVQPSKTLILSWMVHFSGLIPVTPLAENKCHANCLIFQINDEYFTSPEYFNTDVLRDEISLRHKHYMINNLKTDLIPLDEDNINSPHVSRSSSPINIDWNKDLICMAKKRFTEIYCKKTDVKNSYCLKKLLRLQELQRLRFKTEQQNIELIKKIKCLSVRCVTEEQLVQNSQQKCFGNKESKILSSCMEYSPPSPSSFSIGRTLKMIMAEQQRIDPHKLLKAKTLQEQLESLQSKQRLLLEFVNSYTERIASMQEQLFHIKNDRQQLQMWLKSQQEKLISDIDNLKIKQAEIRNSKNHKRLVIYHIERRMSILCMELQQIYPISTNIKGFYTICNVPYPSLELGYLRYDTMRSTSGNLIYTDTSISPINLGVSLGYVAHLIQIMSKILNRPLRNSLICEGSRSRIVDATQEIPGSSRELPLYCHSMIPTTSVKSGIHLLNQNITQLCYDITGNSDDIYKRSIMENILHIYSILNEIQKKPITITEEQMSTFENRLQNHFYEPLSSKNAAQTFCNRGIFNTPDLSEVKGKKLLRKAANDLVPSNSEINTNNASKIRRRVCRSAGSYTDNEDDFQSVLPSYSHSDTNLKTII